jgi:hypothetical protein
MRHDYIAMLQRLCILAGVPDAEHEPVMRQEAMMIAELPVLFQLDEASGFVKIHIDVGMPSPAALPALCQSLLKAQFNLPPPFAMLSALHAQSGHMGLIACMPLCPGEEDCQAGFEFLQACVQAALLLKEGIENGDPAEAAW